VRASAIVLAILALGVAGYTWFETLTGSWRSAPNEIRWHAADGTPIRDHDPELWEGCRFVERSGFDGIIDGERWITPCVDPDRNSAFAWIEPARGVGKLAWPIPRELRFDRTVAAIPAPDGVTVLVWFGESEELVVGFAGRDGWLRGPERITDQQAPDTLRAVAWVDGALELVIQNFEIVRVPARGEITRRTLARCASCDEHVVFHGPRGWTALAEESPPNDRAMLFAGNVPAEKTALAFDALRDVDQFVTGLVDIPAHMAGQPSGVMLTADLRLVSHPESPIAGATVNSAVVYVRRRGDAIERHLVWDTDNATVGAQRLGGMTFVARDKADQPLEIGSSMTTLATVAAASDCVFSSGVWMPDGDGFVLATVDGCYVRVDRELRRRGAPTIEDYLDARAPAMSPAARWRIAFVLLGLFPMLFVTIAIGAIARRRLVAQAVSIGALLYLAAAVPALVTVLPLFTSSSS
jgi:hypothetical protein